MAAASTLQTIPTTMAIPVYVSENAIVGRCVFENFIHEEFEEEGVSDEILEELPIEDILGEDVVTDQNGAAANYVEDENFNAALQHAGVDPHLVAKQVGAHIRELAISFSQSRERKKLKQHADEVDFTEMGYDGFFALCEKVFEEGLTKENVIALFFFFADVLMRCVKDQMKELGIRLFKWALKYIVDRVCKWVAENGGWENAVRRTISNISSVSTRQIAYGAGAAAVAVGGIFIYYKYYT